MTIDAVIKVLCVDDAANIAEAVRTKLELGGGFEWSGHLPSADRLQEMIEQTRPDVVLLDVDMPGRNPFDALREVSARYPELRVIMLSGHIRRELVDAAFEAGAWGYISKNDDAAKIPESLRRAVSGELVMSPEVRAICGE